MARELPILECRLDLAGLREQQRRYARVAATVTALDRDDLHLIAHLGPERDDALVDELVAVERDCCPFFAIDWNRDAGRLSFSVAARDHAPALDAIADSLAA